MVLRFPKVKRGWIHFESDHENGLQANRCIVWLHSVGIVPNGHGWTHCVHSISVRFTISSTCDTVWVLLQWANIGSRLGQWKRGMRESAFDIGDSQLTTNIRSMAATYSVWNFGCGRSDYIPFISLILYSITRRAAIWLIPKHCNHWLHRNWHQC